MLMEEDEGDLEEEVCHEEEPGGTEQASAVF